MRKNRLTFTVLGIFIGCTAVLVVMMIAYGVLSFVNKSGTAEVKPDAVVTEVAEEEKPAETSQQTDTVPDEAQPADSVDDGEQTGDSSMVFKVGGSEQSAESQNSRYTGLYQLDQKTPVYILKDDEENTLESPDLYSKGYYTGRPYKENSNYIAIDYRDGTALVPAENAKADTSAVILPVGMISQVTDGYVGYAGSAPACLHMMQLNTGINPLMDELKDYAQLLAYAEDHGYSDQGSLYLYGGGMTASQVITFASDIYGFQMKNVYDETKKPSEVIRDLLDGGRQAMVLVRFENGDLAANGSTEQYVLFTGYTEKNGYLELIYANAYREDRVELGYPLKSVDAETIDSCAGGKFRDTNAILCIEK